MKPQRALRVLVTGATGYIGGRLVPRLVAQGHQVRCVAPNPGPARGACRGQAWKLCEGLSKIRERQRGRSTGIDVAYYLVHSMAAGQAFRERDRIMALAFGNAAAKAGVRRIIYLGGLGDPETVRSMHLVSRQEVGRCLTASGVPRIEIRAAVIVGSGSASFEMIRHLDRAPARDDCSHVGEHAPASPSASGRCGNCV